MIMNKQEKIIEAWGVHYAPDIDENGFRKYSEFDKHLLYQWSDDWFLKSYNEVSKEWCVIPKSLTGIEDNNGWIKIESEADLPKQKGMYWTIAKFNEICANTWLMLGKEEFSFDNGHVTHYQPIIKPNTPIY